MSNTLNYEQFANIEGDDVTILVGDQQLPANIFEVTKLDKHGDSERDPFSILFYIQHQEPLLQQTYQVSHPSLGAIDIFLVPLGPKSDGISYEAVFT